LENDPASLEHAANRRRHVLGIQRVEVRGRVSARLWQRTRARQHRGTSPRHRIEHDQTKPLVEAGDDQRVRAAQERVAFQGLPARICWLGYGERDKAGLAFNDLVASGAVSAPVVIGRDHLDAGSVASPYRETESMADGSDAIADWPVLNALTSTASGATWVSFHHGGGVGIGRSLHAGQVCVADGTPLAAAKVERVLSNDPGLGVLRHIDSGDAPQGEATLDAYPSGGVRLPR